MGSTPQEWSSTMTLLRGAISQASESSFLAFINASVAAGSAFPGSIRHCFGQCSQGRLLNSCWQQNASGRGPLPSRRNAQH